MKMYIPAPLVLTAALVASMSACARTPQNGSPVVASTTAVSPATTGAEAVVATGQADAVGIARGILYNPRWPWHAAAALGVKVPVSPQYRRCEPLAQRGLFA